MASDIRKIRKSSDELHDLEMHQKELERQIQRSRSELEVVAEREARNRAHLAELAGALDLAEPLEQGGDLTADLERIRAHLADEEREHRRLAEARQALERQKGQLVSLRSIVDTPADAAYATKPLPMDVGEMPRLSRTATADQLEWVEVLRVIQGSLEGEDCPVCGRDYAELGKGSLRRRIAAEIEHLERLGGGVRGLSRQGSEHRIVPLSDEGAARRSERRRLASALEKLAADVGVEYGDGEGLSESSALLARIEQQLATREHALGRHESESPQRRGEILGRLDQALDERGRILRDKKRLSEEVETLLLASDKAGKARSGVDEINTVARQVRKEALKIRQDLLQKVYSRPLNDLWCDLFERLVRDETFRPVLADPKSWWGKLRTWTRARAEGVKKDFEQLGAVLSSGNLNTAGLTLFLALNLIEEPKMSTLVLDDPVQNMDDLHLVQLASLLRTLVHDAKRQLVVAVHERSLFDFLCLELGPTYLGGSLLALEVARRADGRSSEIHATRHEWEPGKIAL